LDLFVKVEDLNAECLGWHVCKQDTRRAMALPSASSGTLKEQVI